MSTTTDTISAIMPIIVLMMMMGMMMPMMGSMAAVGAPVYPQQLGYESREIKSSANERRFIRQHKATMRELLKLSELWQVDGWSANERLVRNYPKYLPSFDEFVADFAGLMRGFVAGRLDVSPGDTVKARWHDDPQWYAGIVKESVGGWTLDSMALRAKGVIGYLSDADDVILLRARRYYP